MALTGLELSYLLSCVEGFLFGLYSAIFFLYLQYHGVKKDIQRAKNVLFYAICALYVLSATNATIDVAGFILSNGAENIKLLVRLEFLSASISGCCDFIAQSILIYRCWIVWGCNIRVVVVPSFLAITFLATWLASTSTIYLSSAQFLVSNWGQTLNLTSLLISIAVNALVTGLIVFRIFKVFREIKAVSNQQTLGGSGGNKLRSIIFILIESGMTLFAIQIIRLVVTIVLTNAALTAFYFIAVVNEMFNGITPTIILVRVSMGLSFHDEKSMVEATGILRFAPPSRDRSNPLISQIESVHQERKEDDSGIDRINNIDVDIDIVER